VGYLVDDLDKACAFLEENGVAFKKKPQEGNMRGGYNNRQYILLDWRLRSTQSYIYAC